MGHLLSSVNGPAADAIQPAPAPKKLPGVGELVTYHMRQGYARMGRTTFPAIVQGHERDTLMLTVIIDAGDLVDETLVEEIGVGREFHVWERTGPDHIAFGRMRIDIAAAVKEVVDFRGDMASLRDEVAHARSMIEKQRAAIQGLREACFGPYDYPVKSLAEILAEFETRVAAK